MRLRSLEFRWVLAGVGLLLLAVVCASILWQETHPTYRAAVWSTPLGDPARGKAALIRHNCGACHVIDGIGDAAGRVGPRLVGLHEQVYIGGVLPNDPDNLAAWIQDPQSFSPGTAMPSLPITDAEARDMAAYLLQGAEDGS